MNPPPENCHSPYYKKKQGQIHFHQEVSFFEMFVSDALVGPKEVIWSLPQKLSEYLVGLYDLCPEVCQSR